MPIKPASRLNEPTAKDRLWFNELTKKASDFFAEPSFYSDQFTFQDGKAIYPPDPERITHQKAKLIRKHGKPHPSIWINRVDLFAIHLEGDGWERLYTANLAGIDRAYHQGGDGGTSRASRARKSKHHLVSAGTLPPTRTDETGEAQPSLRVAIR